MVSWRKNLYAVFITELLVITGFNFIGPFMPLYIQELGNFTNKEAAFWSGVVTGGGGIAMFLTSPLWGVVADRMGRKPMLLRSVFGSAVVLALTGLAPNILSVVVLRFVQGALSGTLAAASALVAGSTPKSRTPFAIGLIMFAMFGGQTIGPLIGGILADIVGMRATFFVTSALMLTGGFIVLFFVREKFEPPDGQVTSISNVWQLARNKDLLPLLIVMCVIYGGPQIISPIIPLFVKDIDPGAMAPTVSGLALALLGVLAAASSIVAGRYGGHHNLKNILVLSCLGTGLLHLPTLWATTVAQLTLSIAVTGLSRGGSMMSANALIGFSAPVGQQGIAYGLAQSAQALGAGLGPLVGGTLASFIGFKPVFAVTAGLLVLMSIFISKLLRVSTADKT